LKNTKHIIVAVQASGADLVAQAQEIANRLDLPLEPFESSLAVPPSTTEERLILRLSNKGVELYKPDDPKLTGAVRVDFTAGQTAFRRKQQKKELLVRAVEGKGGGINNASLKIIDATGGLGRDSFLLAAAGHQVCIFECQPVIAALLADGLARAGTHPETAKIAQRIRLIAKNAVNALEAVKAGGQEGQDVDVVYLDPMFPERRKSALVKKELQLLQLLAHLDSAPEQLLTAALQVATHRVVVKRPVKAPVLADCAPSHSLSGKTVRFDVYLGGLLNRNRKKSG
jgi:16S rRNA (guanine1516-N2)-methyltransferase